MKFGETIILDREIEINAGKKTVNIKVTNAGDRPVQVGSHCHFFEVNKLLDFDRAAAYWGGYSQPNMLDPTQYGANTSLIPFLA